MINNISKMSSDIVCGPVSDASAVVGVVYRVGDWLPGEEDRMIEMYNSGADILCMRDTLGRAAGSICARLKKLFKIDYNDIRGYTDYKNSDEYAKLIENYNKNCKANIVKSVVPKSDISVKSVSMLKWSSDEDELLCIGFENGKSVQDLRSSLNNKNCGVIISRMIGIGLIKCRKDAPGYDEYCKSEDYRVKLCELNKSNPDVLSDLKIDLSGSKSKIINGTIYCIFGNNLAYIGKTSGTLLRRFSHHKSNYNKYKKSGDSGLCSVHIFDACNGDPKIISLLKLRCSILDLSKLERRYIEWYDCVNNSYNKKNGLRMSIDCDNFVIPHDYLKDVSCELDEIELNCAKLGITRDELLKKMGGDTNNNSVEDAKNSDEDVDNSDEYAKNADDE